MLMRNLHGLRGMATAAPLQPVGAVSASVRLARRHDQVAVARIDLSDVNRTPTNVTRSLSPGNTNRVPACRPATMVSLRASAVPPPSFAVDAKARISKLEEALEAAKRRATGILSERISGGLSASTDPDVLGRRGCSTPAMSNSAIDANKLCASFSQLEKNIAEERRLRINLETKIAVMQGVLEKERKERMEKLQQLKVDLEVTMTELIARTEAGLAGQTDMLHLQSEKAEEALQGLILRVENGIEVSGRALRETLATAESVAVIKGEMNGSSGEMKVAAPSCSSPKGCLRRNSSELSFGGVPNPCGSSPSRVAWTPAGGSTCSQALSSILGESPSASAVPSLVAGIEDGRPVLPAEPLGSTSSTSSRSHEVSWSTDQLVKATKPLVDVWEGLRQENQLLLERRKALASRRSSTSCSSHKGASDSCSPGPAQRQPLLRRTSMGSTTNSNGSLCNSVAPPRGGYDSVAVSPPPFRNDCTKAENRSCSVGMIPSKKCVGHSWTPSKPDGGRGWASTSSAEVHINRCNQLSRTAQCGTLAPKVSVAPFVNARSTLPAWHRTRFVAVSGIQRFEQGPHRRATFSV